MSLLSLKKRKEYFKYLGLGEYNETNIRGLQEDYFEREKDIDGRYGHDTDILLRHLVNVAKYTRDFDPEEFKCGCGGKFCTGYPSYMKRKELEHIQTIRSHFHEPMRITCGLRCKPWNARLVGSSNKSKHMDGKAVDFYMKGVTDTLARRKLAIEYIRKLPHHGYTYGNGCSSLGVSVKAPNMGNALHTDIK